MITPTVGRIVWFYPPTHSPLPGFALPDDGQPLPAVIARVSNVDEGVLNLTVFDAEGVPHPMINVPLFQDGQAVPREGRYATWMPYQINQDKARKAEGDRDIPAHQQRVIDEKADLDEKLAKLAAFFGTPTFARLDQAEQRRLYTQKDAMQDYSDVLAERIGAF